jgi:hypothetical protein
MENPSQTRTFSLLDKNRAVWQAPAVVGAQ